MIMRMRIMQRVRLCRHEYETEKSCESKHKTAQQYTYLHNITHLIILSILFFHLLPSFLHCFTYRAVLLFVYCVCTKNIWLLYSWDFHYSGIITVVIIYTFPDWYTFSRDKMQWDTIWSRVWMCTKNPKYIHPSLYTTTSIQSKNKKQIVFLREVEKIGVDVFLFILPHVYAYCLPLRVYVYQYSKSEEENP